MNTEAPPVIPEAVNVCEAPLDRKPAKAPSLLYRALAGSLKFLWGMIFCQSLVGSILVVGWTYRLAQRQALKQWWKRSRRPRQRESFADFLAADERTRVHRHWPNWFFRQNAREAFRRQPGMSWRRYAATCLAAPLQSLWENFRTGLAGIFNTLVLTFPACLFWWFGWYDGWNNSFNKGYEQAAVGPVISILGIMFFIAAMFYVPLAQARQAATGEWRSFYQFRLVWQIIRRRWLSCAGLAALYSLLSVPLSILKVFPMYAPQTNSALEHLSDAAALRYLNHYFFWCAGAVLPAYVILRVVAARLYASGILAAVQTGQVSPGALAQIEREALERLDLLRVSPEPERHLFVRLIAWTGTLAGQITAAVVTFLLWFSFAAQIYVAEFLNYHTAQGWPNQPLVQLPWFHYVPARLKNPLAEVGLAVLVLFAVLTILLLRRVAGRMRR